MQNLDAEYIDSICYLTGEIIESITIKKENYTNKDGSFDTVQKILFKIKGEKRRFIMYYNECCLYCGNIRIDDISGDLRDLIGSEMLTARCNWSDEKHDEGDVVFYKLETAKGCVVIKCIEKVANYGAVGFKFKLEE